MSTPLASCSVDRARRRESELLLEAEVFNGVNG